MLKKKRVANFTFHDSAVKKKKITKQIFITWDQLSVRIDINVHPHVLMIPILYAGMSPKKWNKCIHAVIHS